MELEPTEIHVWSTDLNITPEQEAERLATLSADESERAHRFRFPVHRQRFIAARSALRQLIGIYTNCAPGDVLLGYNEHQKPYLQSPSHLPLEFNLAHSEDIAVYAFTLNHPVGIDIEKIQGAFNQGVADRYFSAQENAALKGMPDEAKLLGFYRIWSRKEAVVKALGKGFTIPLSSFSVSINDEKETVQVEGQSLSLMPLGIDPNFQSALASVQPLARVKFWRLVNQEYSLDKVIQNT